MLLRGGYYWSSMMKENARMSTNVISVMDHALTDALHSVTFPWPFYQWGMETLSPFHLESGQIKILLMGVAYFIKWILEMKDLWSEQLYDYMRYSHLLIYYWVNPYFLYIPPFFFLTMVKNIVFEGHMVYSLISWCLISPPKRRFSEWCMVATSCYH